MKARFTGFRNEILVLFYAVQNKSVPLLPKLVAASSLLYLLSPIDLIPDFIPFAGWLDDLIVVPLLLHFSYRLLPAAVVQQGRLRVRTQGRRLRRGLLIGILLILAGLGFIYWYYRHRA